MFMASSLLCFFSYLGILSERATTVPLTLSSQSDRSDRVGGTPATSAAPATAAATSAAGASQSLWQSNAVALSVTASQCGA